MKHLYLHIGMPKTGSTSIQESLGQSRVLLEQNDVYYPKGISFNHNLYLHPLLIERPDLSEECRQQNIITPHDLELVKEKNKKIWVDEIESTSFKKYILSSEALMIGSKKEIEDKLLKLKSFFGDAFEKITVVVYVRDPVSFYSSIAQQILKNRESPLSEIKKITKWRLYKDQLNIYAEQFGRHNLVVRPFDVGAFYKNNLIHDFLKILGLDDLEIDEVRANTSLNHESCLLLSKLNQAYPRYVGGILNINCGLADKPQHLEKILSKTRSSKKFKYLTRYTDEDVSAINDEVSFVNKYLDEKWRFKLIEKSEIGESELDKNSDLNEDYYLEVINECLKEISRVSEER